MMHRLCRHALVVRRLSSSHVIVPSRCASTLNKYSRRITQSDSQGGSQAMLYAVGLTEADMQKPQVGIASVWWEGNPCNMHLDQLALAVKQETVAAGNVVGLRFNTIGVSDAISMGTDGMSYSLPSRDIIADSIETVCAGQWYDGLVTIAGCDKNMPGCVMAMARLNRPSLMIYGGAILNGKSCKGQTIGIVDSFQAYGAMVAGKLSNEDRLDIVRNACPGPGGCGGMYTANTMSSAIEALGLSLPYSSTIPAVDPLKIEECKRAARAVHQLLVDDIKPSDIMTVKAFENAITVVMALGGSTNAVLHLIAMADAIGLKLTLRDFQRISDKTPLLADFKPSGKYVMADLHTIGGMPAVIKYLISEGLLHGDCITVTGKTLAQNVANLPSLGHNAGFKSTVAKGRGPGEQELIHSVSEPIKPSAHLQMLRGNIAPDGAVAKITGKEGLSMTGSALVYDSEEEMLASVQRGDLKKGEKYVVVIRYEGPKGGPGMPEMLTPTSLIMGGGYQHDVALITDGRFSGASHGFIIGHVSPEAAVGGPIALIKNGDKITLKMYDEKTRGTSGWGGEMTVDVSEKELNNRRKQWKPKTEVHKRGILKKYVKSVQSASLGCVTDA